MKKLQSKKCPFANLPSSTKSHWGEGITVEEMREIHWLKPKLVAQIKFTEWTKNNHLRHADFLALRSDNLPLKSLGKGYDRYETSDKSREFIAICALKPRGTSTVTRTDD